MTSNLPAPQPLRVAQVIETMDVGGAEHLAVQVAGALAARGHRSHLIVTGRPGLLSARIDPAVRTHYLELERAPIRTVFAFGASVVGGLRRLAGVVRDENLDVVQTHLPGSNFWGLALAMRRACGVVATIHNNEEFRYGEHDNAVRAALRRAAYGQIVRRCGVVAVSAAVKESIVRQLGLGGRLADRIAVVPNAVPLRPPLDPDRRASVRARYAVAGDETLLLAAGRFCEQKNFGDLVTAAARLADRGAPFRLVIAGDGEDRPALEARVAAAGLEGRVWLPGNLVDLDQVMGAADAFVMSSLWEGLPLVLLEAMSSGLPTVAYAIDGVSELVADDETGLTAPVGDPDALADTLATLVEDADRRRRLGRAAAAVIHERFSFDTLVTRLEACYRQAIAER